MRVSEKFNSYTPKNPLFLRKNHKDRQALGFAPDPRIFDSYSGLSLRPRMASGGEKSTLDLPPLFTWLEDRKGHFAVSWSRYLDKQM